MNFYEKFVELCEKKGVTPSRVTKEIGIGTANATYWKKGSIPSVETMLKLAEYFGVTIDCLLETTYNSNDTQKNTAESEEEDPAETAARAERLYTALVEAGWIPEGGDLTDEQLNLLEAVVLILKSAFPE